MTANKAAKLNRPTSRDDLVDTLAFALRFRRGKRSHDTDETMANIVAKHLLDHLEAAGYRIMKSDHYRGWHTPRREDLA